MGNCSALECAPMRLAMRDDGTLELLRATPGGKRPETVAWSASVRKWWQRRADTSLEYNADTDGEDLRIRKVCTPQLWARGMSPSTSESA